MVIFAIHDGQCALPRRTKATSTNIIDLLAE